MMYVSTLICAMKIVWVLIICFASYIHSQEVEVRQSQSDVGLNEKELAIKYGYPVESHRVKTEDGYILKMFRIPSGRNSTNVESRPAALLMPSFLTRSSSWLLMGPEKGLGVLLADAGYDVWLGNPRGTTWSRKHESLSPRRNKKEFWNFSMHEIGYYDNPASIDYILNITRQEKLFYVGYSQGCTTFFIMSTLRPEYNKKIQLMCALSPFLYGSNSASAIIRFLGTFRVEIQSIADIYNIYEVASHSPAITLSGQLFCNDGSPFQVICASIFYFIAGFTTHFNHSTIPVIASQMPAGASVKQFLHYGQLFSSQKFQQYDYGEAENMVRYGQQTPPEYNLSKATIPVAVYYGGADVINSDIDVKQNIAEIPNVVAQRFFDSFNHVDFLWAYDVVPLLYNDVLKIMKQYQQF